MKFLAITSEPYHYRFLPAHLLGPVPSACGSAIQVMLCPQSLTQTLEGIQYFTEHRSLASSTWITVPVFPRLTTWSLSHWGQQTGTEAIRPSWVKSARQ